MKGLESRAASSLGLAGDAGEPLLLALALLNAAEVSWLMGRQVACSLAQRSSPCHVLAALFVSNIACFLFRLFATHGCFVSALFFALGTSMFCLVGGAVYGIVTGHSQTHLQLPLRRSKKNINACTFLLPSPCLVTSIFFGALMTPRRRAAVVPESPTPVNSHRVLQCYRAWKEAAGLLSLIHLQRQEVAPGHGSMDTNEPDGAHSRQGMGGNDCNCC